ncbi:uncharacterized protein L3040_006612 [Drepanopeziza brunnea f. sp. 'multigermtubi']|uniref:uncharacterized protein n=1 Tax=Drepanopeziza brunnea f. sp. 'multigermtubi' TaxID=698441 RepID=UPI002385970E|nr:hypothetical protein L3040_006612 [Drepanopeziza brunnea f. sp. 'multigermtubi']
MPPAGRKGTENQYLFNLGVKGRKTGIEVPDTGIRDENGLEPMDHLFSSPEKEKEATARKANGARNMNATISSEEDMDVDESTIPEPNDVLTERQRASGRLPPLRANSPIKTYLKSPARRNQSLGPVSSPIRGSIVESRAAANLAAPVRRKLDFSNTSFQSNGNTEMIDGLSDMRAASELPARNSKLTNGKLLTPFQPAFSDVGTDEHEKTVLEDSGFVNEDSFQMVNGGGDDAVEEEREESQEPEPTPEPPTKSKGKEKATEEVSAPAERRGRPKKVLQSVELPTKSKGKAKATEEVSAPAEKRGRPKKAPQPVEEEIFGEPEAVRPAKRGRLSLDDSKPQKKKGDRPQKVAEPEPEPESEPEIEDEALKPQRKRGRSQKVTEPEPQSEVEGGPDEPEEEQGPAKRTRRSLDVSGAKAVKATGKPKKATASAPTKEPKGKEKAVEEPTSNTSKSKAKAPSRKPKQATVPEVESPAIQRGPPMPRNNRGLFILRRETPLEGAGFKQTRSGRNSIKPLAYWKNERVEWAEDEDDDGLHNFVLPRIKEVVRAEEISEPKRKVSRSKSKAPKPRSKTTEPESDEDEEAEPWEMEPGRIYGEVKSWDPEDPSGAQAEEVQEEIALSAAAIITRDIPSSGFKFAKTLTLPFFGSGMVDLPPKAMKKSKNSRKMQMVFFVFSGRVQVTVNDNIFSIGKGGMWQVPRGNFYSIENEHDKPARIFFSQGCEITDDAGAGESQ